MALSREEYPALLRSLSPGQAINVLDERVKLIAKINYDIADWLGDRRRVEEAYVQGLKRLASRRPQEVSSELGIFRTPWQNIVASVDALAQSHSILAQKIEIDVERPLKEYQNRNREMQAISQSQGNLTAIAKEMENAQKKAAKLTGNKTSANKVANATSDAEEATQAWQSQAPYVFEQLQALDESRINHLRDVLTQLETHEVDQVERSRTSAESCLNALLNINTAEEISAFVARQTANAPATLTEGSTGRNRRASSVGNAPPPQASSAATTPARKPQEDDRFSPYSTTSSRIGPPTTSKKGFGGLRRLGTVLGGRDKGSKGMERPPSPDKRARRNPLRRGQSSRQDMQQIDSPPQTSSSNLPSQAPQLGDPLAESDYRRPATLSGSNSNAVEMNEVNTPPMQPPSPMARTPVPNGIQRNRDLTSSPGSSLPSQVPESLHTQDRDGYSVPPAAVDDITRAQQEASAMGDDPSQFKLSIRDAPIPEDDKMAQQNAFSTVASTLRAQAPQGGAPRKAGTVRGRRDVRNTIFVPSGQSLEQAGLGGLPAQMTAPSSNITAPIAPAESRGSDAQSIRSAHSQSGSTVPVINHPNMHQPGLNASIVETVSASFNQGQVTKAVVIGELALQHNSVDSGASTTSDSVRLDNFAVLEKVAPNPTFISQKPHASGEYTVSLSSIARPAVAFKYQVHLDDASLAAHAPLVMTPTWKIEPTQTSVILTYAFNPTFVSPSGRSVSLKNVILYINIDGTKATSCQSKPSGILSKEKTMIYWKLGDVNLDGYSEAPQKLLARFTTEGEAKPGAVEARWEISSEHAGMLGSGLGMSQKILHEGQHDGPGTDASAGHGVNGGNDPFADDSTSNSATTTGAAAVGTGPSSSSSTQWKTVPLTRRIVSGKYTAM